MSKKRVKANKIILPSPGDVFLMPLSDGRFGVCRVLRENTESERVTHGEPYVLVASSSWIGDRAPDLNDKRIRQISLLTHHSWQKQPDLNWVSEPPPDDFQKIGTIEPSASDKRKQCLSSGGWSFAYHALAQWRWDHDREAVLLEEAEEEANKLQYKQSQEYRDTLQRQLEIRDAITLVQLRKKKRFSDWKEYAPDRVIPVCRAIFRETIDSLVALADTRDESLVMPIFQKCIERLNDLDETNESFIETTIREELCDEFSEIVYACVLRGHEELADRWRDW